MAKHYRRYDDDPEYARLNETLLNTCTNEEEKEYYRKEFEEEEEEFRILQDIIEQSEKDTRLIKWFSWTWIRTLISGGLLLWLLGALIYSDIRFWVMIPFLIIAGFVIVRIYKYLGLYGYDHDDQK